MTKNQAYMIVAYSAVTQRDHAATVTLAQYRYFVRTLDGSAMLDQKTGLPVETNDLSYALSARNACGGAVIDRYSWKNN